MTFANCFLCNHRLSTRAIICSKCGDPDPHHVNFLINRIRAVLNKSVCPRYSDGIMECYDDSDQIHIFHKVCSMFLVETLQEISNLIPHKLSGSIANFFTKYLSWRGHKRLERVIFEHNSIVLAVSDYLFSPLPNIEKQIETSKLSYLLMPSLKPPFYLKGIAEIEDVKHHALLYEAMCKL